jgi:hypothetical protein
LRAGESSDGGVVAESESIKVSSVMSFRYQEPIVVSRREPTAHQFLKKAPKRRMVNEL